MIDADVREVVTWKELVQYYLENFRDEEGTPHWVFRGHQCACWGFTSTLDRCLQDLGYESTEASQVEDRLIREFKRRAHHYETDVPAQEDTLQWIALMRHFGAPTRLLDCTYSLWVALFFAIETANTPHLSREDNSWSRCSENCYAVWALDAGRCRIMANRILKIPGARDALSQDGVPKSSRLFDKYFRKSKGQRSFIYHVNPFRLNERITAQQGVFLCPGNISASFEKNLATLKLRRKDKRLLRVRLDSGQRLEALRELRRMGITRANLFPGLEGFSKSLVLFPANRKLVRDVFFGTPRTP